MEALAWWNVAATPCEDGVLLGGVASEADLETNGDGGDGVARPWVRAIALSDAASRPSRLARPASALLALGAVLLFGAAAVQPRRRYGTDANVSAQLDAVPRPPPAPPSLVPQMPPTLTTISPPPPPLDVARALAPAATPLLATTPKAPLVASTTFAAPRPPRLFCWSHMLVGTPEEELVRLQFDRNASIFACDGYVVISNKAVNLGPVHTWVNEASTVGMGKYGINGQKTNSYLNTQTFLQAWDTLVARLDLEKYDFVVKVDPDAVFFGDRLRDHVQNTTGDRVYYTNCGIWNTGPKLYGSVEVFSALAMETYREGAKTCKALPWQGWGEDYYMQHCMQTLGVRSIGDFKQVGDGRCVPAPCSDWTKVAFHPFKDVRSYFDCFDLATGQKPAPDTHQGFTTFQLKH